MPGPMGTPWRKPSRKRGLRALILTFLLSLLVPSAARARELSMEDRVECQTAIERVYYAHQIGASRPFEEAVPRNVLEKKVATYLRESAALETFWRTPVTAEMLVRETERLVGATRLPGRLRELFSALRDDPFLIQECLARPTLVDRMARNLFAYDQRLHSRARQEAEELRRDLARLGAGAFGADPRRFESEMVQAEPLEPDGAAIERAPDEYVPRRARAPERAGKLSVVQEERETFVVRVVPEEQGGRSRIAGFTVRKRTWDDWWAEASPGLDPGSVPAVASSASGPPLPVAAGAGSCSMEEGWANGRFGEVPSARSSHTAVWTGSVMLIWGPTSSGSRYDPATDSWAPISTTGAPYTERGPSAVWTGSVMVVWGGFYDTGAPHRQGLTYPNAGARYDPVTDSWTPMSIEGAPSGRERHGAIWTGRLMLVWGGLIVQEDGFGRRQTISRTTGGRYDPETDTWTPISMVGAPVGRSQHATVWSGSEMIVWGGRNEVPGSAPLGDTTTILDTGGRYDPATNTWASVSMAGAPTSRTCHVAAWTGTEMIVWGGSGVNTGGRYNPATDTWTPTTTVEAPLGGCDQTAVWTGKVMVVWGGGADGRYDPAMDAWTPVSTTGAPTPRFRHSAVWTGTLMIVWGGEDDGPLNTGGRYDPLMDSWTPTRSDAPAGLNSGGPEARSRHSSIWTGSLMIVWGGYAARGAGYLDTGGRYDPATDTWTPTSTTEAPAPRYDHTAVWTGRAMIVWGGETIVPDGSDGNPTGGQYDPATDTWTPLSTAGAPTNRTGQTAVWTGTRMLVWGGGGWVPDPGGRYDPATDSWTPISTMAAPTARSYHKAVWTGTEMIVWGGWTGTFPSPITGGRYNPETNVWTPTAQNGAPTETDPQTAVWTGREMIVRGARYDPHLNAWRPTSTTGAPGHSGPAVWTGREMIVWGGEYGDYTNTGGRYDPTTDTWTPTTALGAPTGRAGHTLIWTGEVMIVWSGQKDGVELATGGRYAPGYAVDADGDGFAACDDCDDSDPSLHPEATELCDGIDNDCTGGVDDGFGVGQSCTAPVDECHQVVGVQECSWSGTATSCSGPTTLHDVAPPVLGLPDRLVIYATSPSGAVVPFSASAADACAGPVAVACSPSPGSTCPINSIGEVTTVSCTAADPQGNSASGGFEVHVAGAVEQLADLSLRVATCDLSDDMLKRVQKDIAEILKAIADGKSSQVCGKLQRFIDQIQALSAKKKPRVPLDEAGILLEDATRIRAVLGC